MSKLMFFTMALTAFVSILLFMTIGVRGDLHFVMELRIVKLAALIQVAVAISLSTVIFQTITRNRILTPSLMGMDALYILLQTLFVFLLGGLGLVTLNPHIKFGGEVIIMVVAICILFIPLLRYSRLIGLMLLTGIVMGFLFRSLSTLIARMIDPNEYAIIQGLSFANFNEVNTALIIPSLCITAVLLLIFYRHRYVLDVLMLGRDNAISLGVNWNLLIVILLVAIGILVSISTALVGPLTFLGLLVVALTDRILKTRKHGPMFLATCLVAITVLVAGQTALEHIFKNEIVLGVLIEFIGGLTFLLLIVTRRYS